MQTLVQTFRASFPKKLRFDQASQALYAECYTLARRSKHKKYIRKQDVQNILDTYEPLPGSPFFQLPIIRHIFLVRMVNSIRRSCGKKSWLYNRNVEEEYRQVEHWLERTATVSPAAARKSMSAARSSGKRPIATPNNDMLLLRESFETEVLANFRVATMYQRMLRLGLWGVVVLLVLAAMSTNVEFLTFLLIRYYWKMNREETLAWFREVTDRHTVAEIPEAYKELLPPPCSKTVDPKTGVASLNINIVELTHPTKPVTVLMVPCPQMAEPSFYDEIGRLAATCDSVVLEGVCMEEVDRLSPVSFFPLNGYTFPALRVHHRYLPILGQPEEPPMLYPAGSRLSRKAYWSLALTPLEVRCVFQPTLLSATKGEAKVGWGRLRELVEMPDIPNVASGSQHIICVPWTVQHVVNIEASLVKYGFTLKQVFPVHWLSEEHLGEHFCATYAI